MERLGPTILILTAVLCFACQDVIVKVIAPHVSLWQMQVVRSVAVVVLMTGLMMVTRRPQDLLPSNWRWPLIRAGFMAVAYLGFYASLPYISLAKAASAFFISPMLITVLAAIFLGEPIGPRRIMAVLVGFAGVVLIVQPGMDGWTPMALLPVGSAFGYACAVVLTRWRCQSEPGFSLTMVNAWLNGAIGAIGLAIIPGLAVTHEMRSEHAFLLEGWLPMGWFVLMLIILVAITHIAGAILSVKAYQIGEASRLAPIEYSYLVLMALFGLAIWGTVPDWSTLAGMALICGAGGFVAWREGRPARPQMQQSTEVPWTPDHPHVETPPEVVLDRQTAR